MIAWIDLGNSLWLSGFLILVAALIFALFYVSAYAWCRISIANSSLRRTILGGLFSGLPLGITGIVAGFLTGSSRSPAVSALVPAILTFTGLIVAYMIGKGRARGSIAGFAALVFSAEIMVGTVLGSASRDRHEAELNSVEVRELGADQEFATRMYCRGLGLIPDISKPCPNTISRNYDEAASH